MEISTIILLYKYKNLPFELIKEINNYIYEIITNDNFYNVMKLWINNKEKCHFLYGHISYWNVRKVTNMGYIFKYPEDFNCDISRWNVSNVTNMEGMFYGATSFNCDLSNWDVSKVTDMNYMFSGASLFNSDLSRWNVSKVTNMAYMFYNATSFDSDIFNWDVSNVINMSYMFYDATLFNCDISNWNVSNVINMCHMFHGAISFNSDLSQWNISNVTDISYMFSDSINFISDLSKWNTSNVLDMTRLFYCAYKFNSDLSQWNVSKVTDMSGLFERTTFTCDLSKWDVSSTTNMSYMFANTLEFNSNIINWDIRNLIDTRYMFYNAKKFNYFQFCKKFFFINHHLISNQYSKLDSLILSTNYSFGNNFSEVNLSLSPLNLSRKLKKIDPYLLQYKMSQGYIPEFKFTMSGSGCVGKSSFIRRFVTGVFLKQYIVTIGEFNVTIPFFTNYGEFRINFCDFHSSELYPSPMRDMYFTDAHGVILLFDLTSRITYKNLPNLYRDITRICGNIPIVICGNKLDLHNKRKIPKEKITYPKKKNLPYFEISIKKMIDIHQPILYLLRQLTGLHNLQFVNQSSSYCPILDQYICDFPIWDDIFGAIHTPLDDSDNDNDDNNNK